VLALAPDAALEIANDKDRTLDLARRLDIAYPATMRIDAIEELPALFARFEFPFVLKPTISWSLQSSVRLAPIEVINAHEAEAVVGQFLAAGVGVLGQQWASGRREGVTLFIVDGDVRARCAHATHRMTPALGGASVLRESIPIPQDIYGAAVRLVTAMGLDGVCEVEFRRDRHGRPLLMEVNARLAGTIKNAVHSGVDFPLMTWQRAAGRPVTRVHEYRTGVRTRWLRGDIRWLRDNSGRAGRPDSVSRSRALWMFSSEFVRTWHYDSVHGRDFGPVIAEIQTMTAAVRNARLNNGEVRHSETRGASHVI
jgi:predicted ATP-grasp superfamily ATP-dependent carboligase